MVRSARAMSHVLPLYAEQGAGRTPCFRCARFLSLAGFQFHHGWPHILAWPEQIDEEAAGKCIERGWIVGLDPGCRNSGNMFRDADQETNHPGDAAGPIDAEPRSGPSSAGKQVIRHHRAADGAEGRSHNAEEPYQVVGHAG